MKIKKNETRRKFAKKLKTALNTDIVIEEISARKDHYHFHPKDEFGQDSQIIICINEKELTFAIGNSEDYPCPTEFSFNLFEKVVKFFKTYNNEIQDCNVSDLDEEE